MNLFLRLTIGLIVAASSLIGATPSPARPPNVVVFLADDAGWGDFSFSGNPMVRTPHIDAIARGGVAFERFYVQPVCSPTRAEFLTGRYHPRGGVRGVSTGEERLDLDERTLAEAFQAAGYATGAFGKWHNGSQWPYHPKARGFDEFFGYTSGHWGEYMNALLEDNGRMVRTEGFIVDVCTDRALAFIERARDRPFFCYVPFTTPHSPWRVPDEDWARFKDRELSVHATDPKREKAEHTRCALAMMENQDRNVGRILRKLEQLGLAENTIVVYFSDNGPNSFRWTGGLRSRKGSTDEGGVRVPLYVRWPAGLPAGRSVREIAGAIDLLPTLTTLAGVARVGDRPLDGRDLTPLLRDTGAAWSDRALFAAWNGVVSVRTRSHMLDGEGRLYDLDQDPGQTTPLNAREPAVAQRLADAIAVWRQEMYGETGARSAPDARPLPVGYREFPVTFLPARDGVGKGGVKRSSSAPNSSFFVNWTNRDDRIEWPVAVETTGRYAVSIDYTCPVDDAGATIELSLGASRLVGRVAPGWDPPFYTDQDTLLRPAAESPAKEFRPLDLGEIDLPRGEGTLTLRALDIPGKTVMEVRRLTLTLLP
jgi:arylsulfatase A-like enzyme